MWSVISPLRNSIINVFPLADTYMSIHTDRKTIQSMLMSMSTSYWFQFLSVDLAPIQKQSSDGVSSPGCLHRGGSHIKEVLEHTETIK